MADQDDPVRRYYDEKKRRYLKNLRDTAAGMRTGTPFDWEEADAYLRDVPVRDVPGEEGAGARRDDPSHRSRGDGA
jgi:hypothetical protein